MRKVLVSAAEAKPSRKQHTKPCGDCPWRVDSVAGWLGSQTADGWLRSAHGEDVIECHTRIGQQCAGAAIYRANVWKQTRDASTLRLAADRTRVFATPMAFKAYHERT